MHMADALFPLRWAALCGPPRRDSPLQRPEAQAGNGRPQAPPHGGPGAFVFAAQMINFTIPATGSSGHREAA